MKKKAAAIAMAITMTISCFGCIQAEEENDQSFERMGFTLTSTEAMDQTLGTVMPFELGAVCHDPDIYLMSFLYMPLKSEEAEEMSEEEQVELFTNAIESLGTFLTTSADAEVTNETIEELSDGQMTGILDEAVTVGSADGYTFYFIPETEHQNLDSYDEIHAEDYTNAQTALMEALESAEYYAPEDQIAESVGATMSFTSKDIDGNTVTSKELFQDNEITMVNVWGTWCHNCVDEMEELAAIHSRLQEKGCGVVGIEFESDYDEATLQAARDLMEEMGTNYPNVLFPEDCEILKEVQSFPTTFFVDKDGNILSNPIIGAAVDEYEPTLDSLLK